MDLPTVGHAINHRPQWLVHAASFETSSRQALIRALGGGRFAGIQRNVECRACCCMVQPLLRAFPEGPAGLCLLSTLSWARCRWRLGQHRLGAGARQSGVRQFRYATSMSSRHRSGDGLSSSRACDRRNRLNAHGHGNVVAQNAHFRLFCGR